jgi:hypothetical protein
MYILKAKYYFVLLFLLFGSGKLYAQNYYPNKISIGKTEESKFYRLSIDAHMFELGVERREFDSDNTNSVFVGTSYPTSLICKKWVCDISKSIHFTSPVAVGLGDERGYIRLGANLMLSNNYLYNRGIAFSLMLEHQEYLSESELSELGVSFSFYINLSKL